MKKRQQSSDMQQEITVADGEKHDPEAKPAVDILRVVRDLSEEKAEELTRRNQLVYLMQNGATASEALQRLGINRTRQWANKMLRQYEKHGPAGLVDGRVSNRTEKTVLTSEVKAVVLKWWSGRSSASIMAVWRLVRSECEEKGLPVPGYHSIYLYINSLPVPLQLLRSGKTKEWEKQGRPVVRFQMSKRSNERWQIDHTQLDIWVRDPTEDGWVVRDIWLTVALDEFSRTIAGFVLSMKHPDAWTTSLLMMNAIGAKKHEEWLNRGLPSVVQPDRGKDFMSHNVQAAMAALGIHFDPDPPYYPNRKGKVERWFLTLDGFLRGLPGHKESVGRSETSAMRHLGVLLTRKQLYAAIEDWIATDYHCRAHSELDRRKPRAVWEETVQLHMPAQEDLSVFLLQSDELRIVQSTGIRFDNATYWSPELGDHWKNEVRIRYNPEDRESILIYDSATGEYLCEARIMGEKNSTYTIEDIEQARRQYQRRLTERLRPYIAEVEEHDRRMADRATWEQARKLVVEVPDPEEEDVEEDDEDTVQAMLDKMKRMARGEL